MKGMTLIKRKWPVLAALGVVLLFCLLLTLTGCGPARGSGPAEETEKPGGIRLTATTTMLADLAENIGGGTVEVTGLMGPGIDPHLYQASAGDIAALQQADVVLYNGIHLEGKMGDIFASLRDQEKQVICVEDALAPEDLIPSRDSAQNYDPHIWFDVSLWKKAAAHVAQELSDYAPKSRESFEQNLKAYTKQLEELEAYITEEAERVPETQRVLITAHDAFEYFGRAYGFEVRGLQGISTETEAGTQDISRLADYITEHRIKAIFTESSVSPKTIEALQAAVHARGFETALGGSLYSDSLGDAESGAGSYILTCKANIETIAAALE